MRLSTAIGCSLTVITLLFVGSGAGAQERAEVLEIQFKPTRFAQIAVWIEDADSGEFLKTLALTEATARRGIGNRPGASQMNSGFRWPYGRREGVLPTWATRRAAAPDAQQFRRVIFQDRTSEGLASRTSTDFSRDHYFCLSFDRNKADKDALDAVSCASVFNSDKGRYMTAADAANGYAEPFEDLSTGAGRMEPLGEHSLYPPRMDVMTCGPGCNDHPDAASFAEHARSVMPELDAVTMATPQGDVLKKILFSVPTDWQPGSYRACVEINVEGDYNEVYNGSTYPTPTTPDRMWDSWAMSYGYAYRGQPSVVYCSELELGNEQPMAYSATEAVGSVSTWDTTSPDYGTLYGMEGMTNDPQLAPGEGADRLRIMDDGSRLRVLVKPPLSCKDDRAPSVITDVRMAKYPDELHAHEWARLSFPAAEDDNGVFRYDVRVSTAPIDDDVAFMQAEPAKEASLEGQELLVPTDRLPGEDITIDIGGLIANTSNYVAVRAVDHCAQAGGFAATEFATPARTFTTVSPCFVATAAYGSPLANEIGALRRFRDRYLQNHAIGRSLVELYYEYGPGMAAQIAASEDLRGAVRTLLTPIVWLADALTR